MAIQGFIGPGYIGNFLSISDLNTRYPPNQYTGRWADIPGANSTIRYISNGLAWVTLPGNDATSGVPLRADGSPLLSIKSQYNLPIWAKAIANVRAGNSRANVLLIGDSTTAGDGSNNTSLGLRSKSYPTYLASIMSSRGVTCSTASSFGGAGKGSTANLVAWDTRLTLGAGWGINAAQTIGGGLLANTTDTTSLTLTPGSAFDTIEIWYYQQAANGTFTVNVGGAALATVNSATGGTGYVKTTVSTGAGAAVQPVNIQRNGTGGGVYIGAINCYDSATPSVSIWNAGWSSSTASVSWIQSGSVFSPIPAIGIMAPHLTIIDLGINDRNAGTSVGTYSSALQTIITAARVSGDVILKSPIQSNPANFATLAVQQQYDAAMQALAITNNIPYISSSEILGSYSTAVSRGLMYDDRHALAVGYSLEASAVADLLIATG